MLNPTDPKRGRSVRDPRSSSKYQKQRAQYINARKPTAPCALCGKTIDLDLPGTHPAGPTIEHTIKVHIMQRMTDRWDTLVIMCCDTSSWALAHRRCQDRQGAQVVNAQATNKSRW